MLCIFCKNNPITFRMTHVLIHLYVCYYTLANTCAPHSLYLSDWGKAWKTVIYIIIAKSNRNTLCALWTLYCTVHKFICKCVGALAKHWLRKALPISDKPKLALISITVIGFNTEIGFARISVIRFNTEICFARISVIRYSKNSLKYIDIRISIFQPWF